MILSFAVLERISNWAYQWFFVSLLIQNGFLEEMLGLDGAGIILFVVVHFEGHFVDRCYDYWVGTWSSIADRCDLLDWDIQDWLMVVIPLTEHFEILTIIYSIRYT